MVGSGMVGPVVYLINLDRSPDRLRFMGEQAEKIGFSFTRIAAVDGSKLPAATRPAPGELGCALSHRLAWQKIVEGGDAWGVVLEDDVVVSADFPRIVADLPAHAPPDADIVKIDASPKIVRIQRRGIPIAGRTLHYRKGSLYGTPGYAISRRACQRLLSLGTDFPMAIDTFLFHRNSSVAHSIGTYVMRPSLVIERSFANSSYPVFDSLIRPGTTLRGVAPSSFGKRIRKKTTQLLILATQPTATYCTIEFA